MINETIIEKASLAMVNRKRFRESLEPIVSLTHAYSGATADLIRENVRAALEAVEGDMKDA